MSETDPARLRAAFVARIQRFTDTMLDRLNEASQEKDADEKETRMLRNVVLKSFRIWDKALPDGQRDPRLEERLRRVAKQVPEIKG
jgi:hypothetical protein